MIERVGIVAKTGLVAAGSYLLEIARWLKARQVEPVFEMHTATLAGVDPGWRRLTKEDLPTAVDLVLVLAGDGTLIGMADHIAHCGLSVPILGVNFGSLGFLTEITLPELYPALEATLAGTAPIEERLMLHAAITRRGAVAVERVVLNDAVITRGPLSRMIDVSVSVGDSFVARFHADGLIVSTPTGSTAYNLSAGGPIVHPAVHALVLTPIAPHILTNRPIVIPASEEVHLQPVVRHDEEEIYVTFDGQSGLRLEPDDVVAVSAAKHVVRLVHASGRSHFEVLRRKLKWAER